VDISDKPKITFVWINNIYGQLICDDPKLMDAAIKRFAVPVENYFFMPAYKSGRWDGKIRFLNYNGTFYTGIYHRLLKYVKNDDLYEMVIDPKFQSLTNKDSKELKEDFFKITEDTLDSGVVPYTHQYRGALKSLYFERGICEHVTSSGKSLTITLTINYLYHKNKTNKILILVPKLDLVEQFVENMTAFGIPEDLIGKYCGYQKDTDEPFIVSTWQSIYKQKEFLKEFTILIVDECHGLKADVVRSVAEKMVNATIRLGFTGTMPEAKADFMLVEGILGPIIDKVGYTELQEAKQIADISVRIINMIYPKEVVEENAISDYQQEKDYIESDISRNKVICKIAQGYTNADKNVLILVKKIEHSETISDMLKKKGMNVTVVTGETKMDDRNAARHGMEKSGGNVIVATVGVYSTGVSINRLHTVIFASAGKSKIQTLQSVGRGLRLHNTKDQLHLYDICENLRFSELHSKKRKKYYKDNNFEYIERDVVVKNAEV
jgi:superfamily II DNA or RNA helicase